jgi:D-alanyl-D-alanine carboxypeptidase/D-alanyl-D-alanine-endopeptidase (penicillin-binding protein 4)
VADQLFLATALATTGEASREAAGRVTERSLAALGVDPEGLVHADGSGLSRANRISARQLAALVASVQAHSPRAAELFRSSLAVAGESGTLEGRMRGTPAAGRVRAKTGWIRGTSALSGIADDDGGGERIFSILVQYPAELSGMNTRVLKPMQDEIAAALVAP